MNTRQSNKAMKRMHLASYDDRICNTYLRRKFSKCFTRWAKHIEADEYFYKMEKKR